MRQILFRIPLPGQGHALTLYGYGAMLCLGFLAAIYLAKYHARRFGQGPDTVYNAALGAFLGGVLGARFFYIVQNHGWAFRPWDLVRIWEGGLTYYGGLLLAAAAVIGYLALTRKPVLSWCDIFTPSLAVGLAFGRIGCLLNGCCFGDVSNLPWAIRWPVGSIPWHHYAAQDLAEHGIGATGLGGSTFGAVCGSLAATWAMPRVHPAQVYAAVNAALLAVLLSLLLARKRRHGQVILAFFLLYSVSRFFLEFIRADEPESYLLGLGSLLRGLGLEGAAAALPRLTISQNVAILTVAASVAGLALLERYGRPLARRGLGSGDWGLGRRP